MWKISMSKHLRSTYYEVSTLWSVEEVYAAIDLLTELDEIEAKSQDGVA